ncbi:MAG: ROK family protein [Elusimicrobiota bacterium]|nr:ROK family protein [Elusimicrobiota bacterium]
MKAIGIDIGGTNTAVSICSSSGRTSMRFDFPTPVSSSPEKTVSNILNKISQRCDLDTISAAGIGVPAMIKPKNGFVFYAPNLGWKNFSVRKAVMKNHRFKKMVFENDANCAAWGIYKTHKAPKPHFLAVLTLGTGIGAGFIQSGKLFAHKSVSVFEAGHIKIVPGGLKCGCGARGCLEAYCGSAYMNKWASGFWSKTRFAGKNLSAREIYDESRKSAAWAKKIWKRYGSYLGLAVSDIVNLFAADKIIFTGGLAGAYSEFKESLMLELDRNVLPPYRESVSTEVCRQNHYIGADGAADLALL